MAPRHGQLLLLLFFASVSLSVPLSNISSIQESDGSGRPVALPLVHAGTASEVEDLLGPSVSLGEVHDLQEEAAPGRRSIRDQDSESSKDPEQEPAQPRYAAQFQERGASAESMPADKDEGHIEEHEHLDYLPVDQEGDNNDQVNRHNRGSDGSEISDEDDASVEGRDAGPISEEIDGSGADEDEGGREREAQPYDDQHHFNKKYSGLAHVDYFRPSPGGLTHLPQQRRYEPVTPAPIRTYHHQHEAAHHVPYYQKHQVDSRPVNGADIGYQRAYDDARSVNNADVGNQRVYNDARPVNNADVGYQRVYDDARPVNRVDVGYQRTYDDARSDGETHRGSGRFASDSYSNQDSALDKKKNSYRRGQAHNGFRDTADVQTYGRRREYHYGLGQRELDHLLDSLLDPQEDGWSGLTRYAPGLRVF